MTTTSTAQPAEPAVEPDSADVAAERAPDEGTPRQRWSRREELRFAGPIVGLTLGIKVLLFAFGAVTALTFADHQIPNVTEAFRLWNFWDGPNYLSLADHGYQTVGQPANYIVFFPGYPLLVAAANLVLPGGSFTAAFVVSGVASVAAALLVAWLVRVDTGDRERAVRAAWFLLIFPTAYFLHIPYTESLFMSFVLGSFVAARSGRWGLAGVVGLFAAMTRLNGVLLIPALAVEAYSQYRRTGRVERSWLAIPLVGVGFLVYLGINQSVFGNPMHFQDVQDAVWHKHFQAPWTSVVNMYNGMFGFKPADRVMFNGAELVALAVGLVATVLAWFYTRPSYAVWAFLNLLLFASTSWIQSTPRYLLTLFPIYLLLAQATRRPWTLMLASAWSLLMFAWFAATFAMQRWAF